MSLQYNSDLSQKWQMESSALTSDSFLNGCSKLLENIGECMFLKDREWPSTSFPHVRFYTPCMKCQNFSPLDIIKVSSKFRKLKSVICVVVFELSWNSGVI